MKSVTERRFINSKKYTKAEREAAELSIEFLKRKYEVARFFFLVIWKLRLCGEELRPPPIGRGPFGITYLADKLTQQATFGKYNAFSPQRGARVVDQNSICTVPTWFSKSLQVDSD